MNEKSVINKIILWKIFGEVESRNQIVIEGTNSVEGSTIL